MMNGDRTDKPFVELFMHRPAWTFGGTLFVHKSKHFYKTVPTLVTIMLYPYVEQKYFLQIVQ